MLKKGIRTAYAVLIAVLCMASCLYGQQLQKGSIAMSQAAQPDSRTLFVKMFLIADQVWAKLPDGTVLRQADFKGRLGDSAADALTAAGVTGISNLQGHVRIVFSKAGYERDIKGIHVKFKQVVECDVRTTAGGMEITNLKGMSVSYPLLPGISVKELTMTKDSCRGNITVSAHVTLVGFIRTSYSVSAGPDGKPLNVQQPSGLACTANFTR